MARRLFVAWEMAAQHTRVSLKSFTDLQHKPQLVDLTVEEGQRLKVIYGSSVGFHVIDVDSGNPYDIYIPSHVSGESAAALSTMAPPPALCSSGQVTYCDSDEMADQ